MTRSLWPALLAGAALAVLPRIAAAQETLAPLTVPALQQALVVPPTGDAAQGLANRIRRLFGADALTKGNRVRTDGLTVAWAVEIPGPSLNAAVAADDGSFRLPLTQLAGTDLYAAVATLPDGAGMHWRYDLGNGSTLGGGNLEVYTTPADTLPQPGVPKGLLTQQPRWKSRVFPNTERDWWVYVPAQYRPEAPACVMVFQDGGGYKNYIPTVFDTLIARGDMPVTVGIFLNPGDLVQNGKVVGSNRSFEYDTLSDQYARFLLQEILPEVEKTVKLRHDPDSRAIAGLSSGGICAFTAAWQRPDQFHRVMSWIGSFTDIAGGPSGIAGGHNYPFLIRRADKKPLRVFLQDGANDLDNQFGNWPLANEGMAKALAFKGYDYRFVFGHGFHSDQHGRAILPDTLRWLWRDTQP